MTSFRLYLPVPVGSPITFTYAQHVARANANHWCTSPKQSPCLKGWYYGGIDYGIPTGTPVKAGADGTIIALTKDSGGYGTHIRIQHADGYMTLYGHMRNWSVALNQTVKAGDVIGYSDNTGNSTGPHLHFELRLNNDPRDPAPYLSDNPPVDPPNPPPPVDVTLPTFPNPVVATVIVDKLNVRDRPSASGVYLGYVLKDEPIKVFDVVFDVSGNLWAETGYEQYMACHYNGEWYMKF